MPRLSTSVQLPDGSPAAVQRACVAAQRMPRPLTLVWDPSSGDRPRVSRRATEEPATVLATVLSRAVGHGGSEIFCSYWSAMTPLPTPRSPTVKITEERSHSALASYAKRSDAASNASGIEGSCRWCRSGLNWTPPEAGVDEGPTNWTLDGGLLATWSLDLVRERPLSVSLL